MRIAVAGMLLAALAGVAAANGRDPFISTINFKAGDNTKIVAGATFGAIRSDDNGATWQWYCERAVGYGGTYDPDYVYAPSGAVFATTFDGLKVMRDGCSFNATPPGMTFVTHVERGGDGAIYFSASDPMDTKIYKSTDDGVTFPTSTMPSPIGDEWWQTIIVAPSAPQVIYLSGYRLPKLCTSNSANPGVACGPDAAVCIETQPDAGACESQKVFLLYKSTNGGTSFQPIPFDENTFTPISQNSAIEFVGVDPNDEDIVYIRVTLESTTTGNSIYKSINGGTSWTKILTRSPNVGDLSFLVRYDGSCVVGTRDIGAWASANSGGTGCTTTWTDLTTAPHINCLSENSAHEVWACTQNTASPQLSITADGWGIMKSTDLSTWTGVLRFEDIHSPVTCPSGTVQQDRCIERYMDENSPWCCLLSQLGITESTVDCSGYMACFATRDTAPDGRQKPPDDHCCTASVSPTSPVLLSLFTAALLLFRGRNRRKPKPKGD